MRKTYGGKTKVQIEAEAGTCRLDIGRNFDIDHWRNGARPRRAKSSAL